MISIVGVLVALLIPAVQATRESARRTACQNNLKQVGMALLNYESANNKFPAGKRWSARKPDPNAFDYAWSSIILGYIEEENLRRQIDFTMPLTDPVNLPATSQVIPIYLCPSAGRIEAHRSNDGRLFNLDGQPGEGLGCIDYLGVSGPDKDKANPVDGEDYGRQRGVLLGTKGLPDANTILQPPSMTVARITDGLSNTICVIECTGRGAHVGKSSGKVKSLNGAWASGDNISHLKKGVNDEVPPDVWKDERAFSDHPSGVNALACDGSVHHLSNAIDPTLLRSIASRDGGESTAGFVDE